MFVQDFCEESNITTTIHLLQQFRVKACIPPPPHSPNVLCLPCVPGLSKLYHILCLSSLCYYEGEKKKKTKHPLLPTRWKLCPLFKPAYVCLVYGKSRILERSTFQKFLLMKIAKTYQNKPERFGEKRIGLKEEMKGKNRVNHV